MASKNDENFIVFCDELRTYVEEHNHFPVRHTTLNHKNQGQGMVCADGVEDYQIELSACTGGRASWFSSVRTIQIQNKKYGEESICIWS